jgi:hypothetical protein
MPENPNMLASLIGKNVFIRTVTTYYTGKLASAGHDWLELLDAAWIADTDRFADALATGKLSEVEPYPGACYVAAGAVVDICHWSHDLPRTQR